jgi:hypothetical protein
VERCTGHNDSRKVQRANLDGSDIETIIISTEGQPRAIALDLRGSGAVYWSETDISRIRRSELDGSAATNVITNVFSNEVSNSLGIALDLRGPPIPEPESNVLALTAIAFLILISPRMRQRC